MKNLLIILILVVAMNGCRRSEIVISEKQLTDDVFYLENEIKPYSGKCLINYTGTSITKEMFTFRKGILNGPVASYYKNKKLKRKGEYLDGRFSGKWEYWDENGNKSYEVHYENDSLNGGYITWYPGGILYEKGTYSKNHKIGKWIVYTENGKVLVENNYKVN